MNDSICWIEVDEENKDYLTFANNLRDTHGRVHNLYKAFSQFPQPVLSADRHYRDVMQSSEAPLALWQAELLSVDVAILNKCNYAEVHHSKNFIDLYDDSLKAEEILDALRSNNLDHYAIDTKTRSLLFFGRKLTNNPDSMNVKDIRYLRLQGFNDSEISHAVQVTACFAYWTRVINALGIKLGNERIGKTVKR